MNELTGTDYRSFLNYFSINYSELRGKFPEEFVWSLGAPYHGMQKPAGMSDFDFNSFREIEFRWLIEKGFIQSSFGQVLFILTEGGFASVSPTTVAKLEALDFHSTKVHIQPEKGNKYCLTVFGRLEAVEEKLGRD